MSYNLVRCLLVLVLVLFGTAKTRPVYSGERPIPTSAVRRSVETASFRVVGAVAPARLQAMADACESLLGRQRLLYLESSEENPWQPKCEVILTSVRSPFSAASTVVSQDDRVTLRQIEIQVDDRSCLINSLPHEMTHIVLADRMDVCAIPIWAGEGLATLQESPSRRNEHLTCFHSQRQNGRIYRLADLLSRTAYPPQRDLGLFYGQSLSVTEFLVRRGTTGQFVGFLESATVNGWDRGLRDVYGLNGVAKLEARWRASLGK